MPRKTIDKDTRKKIQDARRMIQAAQKADCNEAETRRRVERIFENLMGYSAFEHLSRERAIRGAGETEHVDFAIHLESGHDAEPIIMVELKRVGVDLSLKHLKQVTSYAIDSGCEWVLLTNGREWKLYHVEFGQPPKTKLVEHWNLLEDDIVDMAAKFELISYKPVKKGSLKKLWERATVLSPDSLLSAIISPESLKVLCKMLRKNTGVVISADDLIKGIGKLLNEAASIELSKTKIVLPEKKKRQRKPKIKNSTDQSEDSQGKGISNDIQPDAGTQTVA
ncbi:MAG: type I restriction enzyme HsdR N-terminal domain-containing protein [Sedimentisphaerales bacterium]|nr:type I restriction enzyme HsdR N-terminal domain-containing protein [Sedimentisphaerales bacterium]